MGLFMLGIGLKNEKFNSNINIHENKNYLSVTGMANVN